MMMGFGLLGGLFVIIFLGIAVVSLLGVGRGGAAFSSRNSDRNFPDVPYGNHSAILSPRDELDRRYASGEIDREKYFKIREDLGRTPE